MDLRDFWRSARVGAELIHKPNHHWYMSNVNNAVKPKEEEPHIMTREELEAELKECGDCPCCRWMYEEALAGKTEIWSHSCDEIDFEDMDDEEFKEFMRECEQREEARRFDEEMTKQMANQK